MTNELYADYVPTQYKKTDLLLNSYKGGIKCGDKNNTMRLMTNNILVGRHLRTNAPYSWASRYFLYPRTIRIPKALYHRAISIL